MFGAGLRERVVPGGEDERADRLARREIGHKLIDAVVVRVERLADGAPRNHTGASKNTNLRLYRYLGRNIGIRYVHTLSVPSFWRDPMDSDLGHLSLCGRGLLDFRPG